MNLKNRSDSFLPHTDDLQKISNARHHDPFDILGLHQSGKNQSFLAYRPLAEKLNIEISDLSIALQRLENSDFFYCAELNSQLTAPPLIHEVSKSGEEDSYIDPYSFFPVLDTADLTKFSHENSYTAYQLLGSNPCRHQDIEGTLFSVWAPNAERVSVVGDFNNWDGRVHPMRNRGASGVWELFLPHIQAGSLYKYEIRNQRTGDIFLKSDPYARFYELTPSTASSVMGADQYDWQDQDWLNRRRHHDWLHKPMSIYEVHLGSWKRNEDGSFLDYHSLAHELVAYVKEHHFTHIELLPITEYPFGGSWGYQVTGYFAPTSRFGSLEDFKYFIDYCHQHNIGVILDWVPAHFPRDAHGLANFDGTALYEHEDPRLGQHKDWDTLIFNYGRQEVINFLLSSAYFWLHELHMDGLRVDAVASMLYLDYSREEGEWLPNRYGGNENLEAIEFLRNLNCILHEKCPGTLVIAEESTSWPQVSRPVYLGGLGFSMKWNMGWMNDTLDYIETDPVYRKFNHEKLTFGHLYSYSENFVVPLSHDEVVHGKHSILGKMPGDSWQKFANVRLLYTYMFSYPGKKLLFMGNEFAQGLEWSHDTQLEWELLDKPYQKGVQQLVKDLGHYYLTEPALHQYDFEQNGFQWIDCHDSTQSVICYMRRSDHDFILAVLNFTPVPRHNYRIGVPKPGSYREILNSDSSYYSGSDLFNDQEIYSEAVETMGFENSINLTIPPLAGLFLKLNSN